MKRIVTFALLSLLWSNLAANDSAREFFKFAKFSYDANEYGKALDYINKAIDMEPEYLNGLILRAEINLELENYYAIIVDVNQIMKLEVISTSLYGHVYALRGAAHYLIGKPENAASDLKRALSSNPDEELANFYLGLMAYDKRSYFEALEFFDQAINSNSDNFEYFFYRAQTKIDNYNPIPGTPTFESIMVDIDRAICLNPEDYRAYKLRCEMLKLNEKRARDIYMEELSKSIELFPEQADFYSQRGMAKVLNHNYSSALSDFTKAIHLNSEDEANYRNRGLCFHNMSKYQLALNDYSKSIDIMVGKFNKSKDDKTLKKLLAETFNMRGMTNQLYGHSDLACDDYYNAAKLGSKPGLNNYRRSCNVFN